MGAQSLSREIPGLRPYVLKVLWPSGEVNGTGFICHPKGFILTCRHVVDELFENGVQPNAVDLAWGEMRLGAEFRPDLSPEQSDLAVLKLLSPPRLGDRDILPLDVFWRVKPGHRLASFGYPQGQEWSEAGLGLEASLGALDSTELRKTARLAGVELYPLQGFNLDNVEGGFSGAPVLDCDTHKVIGLVSAKHKEHQAFVVPLAKLFTVWPDLQYFHDIYRRIRERFAEEAREKLRQHLRGTSFIRLGLERGVFPEKEDKKKEDNGQETEEGNTKAKSQGREWKPLDLEQLLPPSGKQILSADAGTGKTTLLFWLTAEIVKVKKNAAVPIFLSCVELEDCRASHWDDLENDLISRYKAEFLEKDLVDCLESAFNEGCLVFLLDGLDQIESRDYSKLAQIAFGIAAGNAVLIAARPSAVLLLESDPEIAFLRLEPLSVDAQRDYFQEYYAEAKRLSAMAPDLAQIPMLAYMIRTLVKKPAAKALMTRTAIYQKFVERILREHGPNAQLFEKDPDLSYDMEMALSVLAYHALAKTPPQIQRVETKLYRSLNQSVKIKDLTKFGLVNFVMERGEKDLLFFTHQSFQEFLAAQHLAKDTQEVQLVLAERWHPKWREVIRFLSGLCGESIIRQIRAPSDNLIHADLFLAARCLPDVKSVSPDLRESVVNDLAALVCGSVFDTEAVESLGGLLRGSQEAALLLPYLTNPSSVIRRIAVQELAGVEGRLPAEVIDKLAQRLEDHDEDVRWATVKALAGLGGEWLPAERIHEEVAEKLLEEVAHGRPHERETALKALAGLGEQLSAEVIEIFAHFRLQDHDDKDVRRAAAQVLGRLVKRLSAVQIFELTARLADKDTNVREAAIEALLGLGERLEDGNCAVREAAIEALARLGKRLPAEVIDKLAGRLEDSHSGVRREAVKAMGRLGERLPPEVIDKLAGRLEDGEVSVRYMAVEALDNLGERLPAEVINKLAGRLEDHDTRVLFRAVEALDKRGKWLPAEVINKIAGWLQDDDWEVRRAAVKALAGLGEWLSTEQILELTTRLTDKDTNVREAAVEALAGLGEWLSAEMIAKVVGWLGDGDNCVRWAAVEALVGLRERLPVGVIDKIAGWLQHGDGGVRWAAVKVLAELGERLEVGVIDKLAGRLEDGEAYVRRAAVEALGRLGERLPTEVIDKLAGRLEDGEAYVRRAAVEALGRLGEQLPTEVIDKLAGRLEDGDAYVRRAAVLALGEPGERLWDDNINVRWAAAQALGRLGERLPAEVIGKLAGWLEDDHWEVRRAALSALSGFGERLPLDMFGKVVERLGGEGGYPAVGGAAVAALAGFKKRLPAEVISQLVRRHYVRQAVSETLAGFGEGLLMEGIDKLAVRLQDDNRDVREAAVKALVGLGEAQPAEVMDKLAGKFAGWLQDDDWEVRRAAVKALGRLGERLPAEVIHKLAGRLEDGDAYLRGAAVEALGRLGISYTLVNAGSGWWKVEVPGEGRLPAEVIDKLAERLQDDNRDVREAAVEALVGLGEGQPAEVIDKLAGRLEDGDAYVRRAAVEALGRLGEQLLLPTEVIDKLAGRLEDGEKDVRRAAVLALGEPGERLWDDNINVRRAAAQALGRLGERLPAEVIGKLAGWLQDDDWEVRRAALSALAGFKKRLPAEVISELVIQLHGTHGVEWALRRAAVEALMGLEEGLSAEVIDKLAERLQDDNRDVREAAVEALAELGEGLPAEVIDKLAERLARAGGLRRGCARSGSQGAGGTWEAAAGRGDRQARRAARRAAGGLRRGCARSGSQGAGGTWGAAAGGGDRQAWRVHPIQ